MPARAGKDCEEDKPEIMITTEPTLSGTVAQALKEKLPGIEIMSSNIGFVPNEDTMVSAADLSEKHSGFLQELIEKLEDYPDVSDVYTNIR